ncbi:restriction endonuclease [Gemmatimonadota bacterium]
MRAWVIRPYPHGKYRVPEFLDANIVAIGWPGIGDMAEATTREQAKARLHRFGYGPRQLGQAAGTLYRFVNEMNVGDYVVVPDGDVVYIGVIKSDYRFNVDVDEDDQGYSHQRAVSWLHDGKALKRRMLTGRVYDSLKGQQTLFSTHADDIHGVADQKAYLFAPEQVRETLKQQYVARLQQGVLGGVNSNTFESAVGGVLATWFPGLTRQATTASEEGDTDLLVDLPGNVTVRVQVKHFYPERGAIEEWVVDQLAKSMNAGDNGIVVTSGSISEQAMARVENYPDVSIAFIDGPQFVELTFGVIDELPSEVLANLGLERRLDFLA